MTPAHNSPAKAIVRTVDPASNALRINIIVC
jgi:hypothetical protein